MDKAFRSEHDSMGYIDVPADRLWSAQTQRSIENFNIGIELMPLEIIHALALIKKAAAIVNNRIGKLDKARLDLINQACDEIIAGVHDQEFPLKVWQTGSGTQTNMNLNEVIATRGNIIAGVKTLHPNDHVNMSQSSNDVFPSAMHVAAVTSIRKLLIPSLDSLIETLRRLEAENAGIYKIGRTHLQDATPLLFSQEISGWTYMLEETRAFIDSTLPPLSNLAAGGTAVGTGLNAPEGFGEAISEEISNLTGLSFQSSKNKFHALTSKDALVFAHGALKALAANLLKIANDVRWLASGPRCGLSEISIPENEPGSSIMPGKVNPTQCEAVTMVACQVIANDVAVGFSASQGNFELNVFMPVCIYNFLQSVRLLSDVITSFNNNCMAGLQANKQIMEANLHQSLMLVTCLTPRIGYDNAAIIAKHALSNHLTLKESAVSLGFLSEEEFDSLVKPENMV